MRKSVTLGWGCVGLSLAATAAFGQPMTADRAVQIALKQSSQAIQAEAGILDARASLFSAYSGMLPRFSAGLTRSGSWVNESVGNQAFGGFVTPTSRTLDFESYSTTPEITGSWSVLNFSALSNRRAAGAGLRAAKLMRSSSRNDIALAVRRQFYDVVQAIQLARVNADALKLSRDNERRVRALFEVGSVSRSDVLRAQVQTAQSELDSLTSRQAITVQRVSLASAIGIREQELGEVDTVLTVEVREFDEGALLAEAERERPDLQAAEAQVRAAHASLNAARFLRLPYVSVGGSAQFKPKSTQTFKVPITISDTTPPADTATTEVRIKQSASRESERALGASISLNWDFFDGFATDARVASARAQLMRAQDTHDALRRNLESEVHAGLLVYREAIERDNVATRALESAEETVKLTQQKYNVGSATILDLIDAQVQLQRARSQQVNALATIRVAEAALDRVRGRAE
jgi:outer membrane protein